MNVHMLSHPPVRRRAVSCVLPGIVMPALAHAQTAAASGTDTALTVTASLTLAIIVILFYVLIVMNGDITPIVAAFHKLKRYVIASDEEKAPVLNEEFDGIHELDNRVPPWFNYLFYGSMVFAAAYMLNFHILKSSKLSVGEYQDELAAAALQHQIIIASEGAIDEANLTVLKDPALIREGMENFKRYCVACHGPEGGGVIGPNLTDKYWLHGGGIKNVYTTIKMGVAGKGMISWQLVFSPKQIQEIASYVLSLQGTNPVGAKKPDGTLWVEPDTSTVAVTADAKSMKKAL